MEGMKREREARLFWQRPDLVQRYTLTSRFDAVNAIRSERLGWLERACWDQAAAAWEATPDPSECGAMTPVRAGPAVGVRLEGALGERAKESLVRAARSLHPWRKGPLQLPGLEIDAEWRSDRKYDRIAPALGELGGRRVIDVGCGNGYYMIRMAAQDPLFVYGIDPSVLFLFQFELVQRYLRDERLQIDLMGAEHLDLFPGTFDVALCMGIVYHQRHPLELLARLRECLRPGGRCLLESQTIPGESTVALFPESRYAKARNVYFVPTAACLENWMRRAGFRDVQRVSHLPVTGEEQRRTEWMTFESLDDFLDPKDPTQTVEGYPAPWRTAVVGFRPD